MDFGADPDVLIGGVIWPTFASGDDFQVILALQRNVPNRWRIHYDDSGILHYESLSGGSTACDLDATEALVFGEWNAWYLSIHDGVATFWVGTIASGLLTRAGSAADTSAYDMGSLGATTGRVSNDAVISGGCMNAYIDHVFVLEGAWVEDAGGTLTTMPVPTAEP
jgi:hypothetical protein